MHFLGNHLFFKPTQMFYKIQPSNQREIQERIQFFCMKIVRAPILGRLFLCVVALLILKSLSTSITKHCNLEFSNNPLYLFILFNAIIIAVIVGSHKPPIDEFDGVFPYLSFVYEAGASFDNTDEFSDIDVFEDDTCSSDGYQEDDDDDDDDDKEEDTDDSWYDEEEYGDDLQKRIEDFIAMVNKGWREERLEETDSDRLCTG